MKTLQIRTEEKGGNKTLRANQINGTKTSCSDSCVVLPGWVCLSYAKFPMALMLIREFMFSSGDCIIITDRTARPL